MSLVDGSITYGVYIHDLRMNLTSDLKINIGIISTWIRFQVYFTFPLADIKT